MITGTSSLRKTSVSLFNSILCENSCEEIHFLLLLVACVAEYLCSPEDNIYNVNFSRFKIRDLSSGVVILDIKKHRPTGTVSKTRLSFKNPDSIIRSHPLWTIKIPSRFDGSLFN